MAFFGFVMAKAGAGSIGVLLAYGSPEPSLALGIPVNLPVGLARGPAQPAPGAGRRDLNRRARSTSPAPVTITNLPSCSPLRPAAAQAAGWVLADSWPARHLEPCWASACHPG